MPVSDAADDPTAAGIRDLVSNLLHAKADKGRAEGHMDAVRTVLTQYLWDAQDRARRNEQIPAVEVSRWLARLWDVATLGRRFDSARNEEG